MTRCRLIPPRHTPRLSRPLENPQVLPVAGQNDGKIDDYLIDPAAFHHYVASVRQKVEPHGISRGRGTMT